MSAYSLSLLDASSSLRDALNSLFDTLFQLPVTITALALTFVCALLGWLIAYAFLRPKEVCSMVCSIHLLLTLATIVLGLVGALGFIDYYFPGSLIIGAGVALIVLAIPLFILVESFNYVVLSNQHARRHRDLRTPQDRQRRRVVVLLAPLALGAALLLVGIILNAAGVALSVVSQIIILLITLWVLALLVELFVLTTARRRHRRLAAIGTGPMLDQQALANLWVSGFSSYRIGRGRTEAIYWEEFTERVVITEELMLEEEGELDLLELEAQEARGYAAAGAAAGAGSAALALHQDHRAQRHRPPRKFRRRWGSVILLLLVAVVATAVTAIAGVQATTTASIALAFLAPVIFLIIHRIRRDSEVRFVTETAEKVTSVQMMSVTTQSSAAATAAQMPPAQMPPAMTPPSRRTTGTQPALHPARPVPVNPPVAEPVIPPKEEPEPPTMPTVETTDTAGAAHVNPDVADETLIVAGRPGAAHENPDIAEDTLLIGHKPVSAVSEQISAAEFEQYLQGVSYPATRDQLLEQARKNKAPTKLLVWLETIEVTTTFTTVVEVTRHYTRHIQQKSEQHSTQTTTAPAAPAAPAPAPAAPRSRSIRITEFQHYLSGISYPATRAELLAQAQKNNAPDNMIARLEELDPTHEFTSPQDVMIGYAYHRTLSGVSYPATSDQLLQHARANKVKGKLLAWLESHSETVTYASLTEVVRSYAAYHAEEEDDDDEDDDKK